MHLDNYGLKAIRAIYFEKLRLYEDSTKYANDVDVSRSAENVLLNVDDLVDANSIDDIREVDYDFTPNSKKNKTDKFDTYKKYNDDIKKRIVKITGEPPKNNVHVGSIVFTLPDEFKNASKKEQVDVFKNWLRFIGDRYGNENIIDCVLHFDETTPHGTVTIVPEAISRKTHQKTVSTASCFTLKDLHNLHKDCDAYFERIYGVEGLINNQKTIGKTKVAKQHLDAFKKERKEYAALTKQNNELKAENQRLQNDVNVKRAEYDKLAIDVENTLDEANNKASGIIANANKEAERIKQDAEDDIKTRKSDLHEREFDVEVRELKVKSREDKYKADSKEFYDVTYPNYEKDKKSLDERLIGLDAREGRIIARENKYKEDYKKSKKGLDEREKSLNDKEKSLNVTEKGLNKRLTWLDAREADLLQREYEAKTDRNFIYNIAYPDYKKKKKSLDDKKKELNEKEKNLQAKEIQVNNNAAAFDERFRYYDRYANKLKFAVKIMEYFGEDDADTIIQNDNKALNHRYAIEAEIKAYKDKYGDITLKHPPWVDLNDIMNRTNKDVDRWEEREKEEGFEPFG